MLSQRDSALRWARGLALVCVVMAGLVSIIGSGGGGGSSGATPAQPADRAIGAEGGTIADASGHTLVVIPAGAHVGQFTVAVSMTSGQLTVDRRAIGNSTIDPRYPITLTLPPGSEGSDYTPLTTCPAAEPSSPFMANCWTNVIPVGYFGDTGGALTPAHRLSKNELKTASTHAILRAAYGAQLTAGAPQTGASVANRVPVLFIHGYIRGGEFNGGGNNTWDALPDLVAKEILPDSQTALDPAGKGFLPFEFRWQTDASYITVAGDLAKAISAIHTATGQRVHIVAHSFGGVLARVLVQDVSDATKGSLRWNVDSQVRSLTTVGTPHSGILRSADSVEAELLPKGWNPPLLDDLDFCLQISCYQAGLLNPYSGSSTGLADFAEYDLMGGAQSFPQAGYIAARLKAGLNRTPEQLGTAIPVLSLVGASSGTVTINGADVPAFFDGDGLISYRGQRFRHLDSDIREDLSLMFQTTTNFGFIVTERILGLQPGVNAFPYDPLSVVTRTAFAARLTDGFWHTSALYYLRYPQKYVADQLLDPTFSAEVATKRPFPEGCAPCEPDTWVNIREFLLSMHGGPASSNFPTTTGNQLVKVDAVTLSPDPAVAGLSLTITLHGVGMPGDLIVALPGCDNVSKLAGGTSTIQQFTCTPAQGPGVLSGTVTSSTGTLLASFTVTVGGLAGNQPPVAQLSVATSGAVAGQLLTFDPAGSIDSDGTIVRWDWTFGDGQTAVSVGATNWPVTHAFAAAGTYSATLKVTDDKGAVGAVSRSVTVAAKPAVGATQMAMTATPDPVRPGELVQYAVTVTNRGVNVAGYTVDAQVPNYSTVPAGGIGQGGFCVGVANPSPCPSGGTVRWTNFSISGGQSATLPFAAMVNTASPPANGTIIRSTATALNGSYSGATAGVDVVVSTADLSLGMVNGPSPVFPGGALSYTLHFGNPGGVSTSAAVLTASLPPGTSFATASDGGTVVGGVVQWNVGALASGAVGQRQFVVLVDAAMSNGSVITATADLRDASTGRSLARANAAAAVLTSSATQMAMTATPDPVRPGELVQYAVTVTNRGVNVAGYTVDAQVPNYSTVPAGGIGQGGFCVGVANPSPCPSGGTVRWTNFSISGGQSATLPFAAMVNTASPPANGTIIRSTATALNGSYSGATAGVDVVVAP